MSLHADADVVSSDGMLQSDGIECSHGVGIYYTAPNDLFLVDENLNHEIAKACISLSTPALRLSRHQGGIITAVRVRDPFGQ